MDVFVFTFYESDAKLKMNAISFLSNCYLLSTKTATKTLILLIFKLKESVNKPFNLK